MCAREWETLAAPRQLSSEVMLCEAILFHFFKHFTRNFQNKINDDCHSNLCYWFPLAFFNIQPHPPKTPEPNRTVEETNKDKRNKSTPNVNVHVFVLKSCSVTASDVKWWKTMWLCYRNHNALNRFSCILDLFNLKSHLHE